MEHGMVAGAGIAASDAWKREGFYLRLTKGRKADLAKIAAGLPGAHSPTSAIDRAIELALEALEPPESPEPDEDGDDGRLAALENTIMRLSSERALDSERQQMRIDEIADGVRRLAELISGAMSESRRQEDSDVHRSPSLGEWLDDDLEARGIQVQQIAIARAHWTSTTMTGPGIVAMAFDVELAGADGGPLPASTRGPMSARLELVDAGSDLARSDLSSPHYLICQPTQMGSWTISAHRQNSDGSMGELLACNFVDSNKPPSW